MMEPCAPGGNVLVPVTGMGSPALTQDGASNDIRYPEAVPERAQAARMTRINTEILMSVTSSHISEKGDAGR